MKTKLTSLLFAAAAWCAPIAVYAESPVAAPPAEAHSQASSESKKTSLTRADRARLKEARELADKDPSVSAAKEAEAVAAKKLAALKRSKSAKPETLVAANNEVLATRAKYVTLRREVIAKEDKAAAELDVRAYAAGEALRKAREENATPESKAPRDAAEKPAADRVMPSKSSSAE